MAEPKANTYFKNFNNSCAVDCLLEGFYFSFWKDVSSKEEVGQLNRLLVQACQRRACNENLEKVREPVWTWLCNHVQSFENVGSTEAAVGDVWDSMKETDADKSLFAVRLHKEVVCDECGKTTLISQAHCPLLISVPNLESAGMDMATAVKLHVADVVKDTIRVAKCNNCGRRCLKSTDILYLDMPVFLVLQMPLIPQKHGQPKVLDGVCLPPEISLPESHYELVTAFRGKNEHFTVSVNHSGSWLHINDIGPRVEVLKNFMCRTDEGYSLVVYRQTTSEPVEPNDLEMAKGEVQGK